MKNIFYPFAFQIEVPEAARRRHVPHQAGGRAALQGPHHHAVRRRPPGFGTQNMIFKKDNKKVLLTFQLRRAANGHGKEGFDNHPGTGEFIRLSQ